MAPRPGPMKCPPAGGYRAQGEKLALAAERSTADLHNLSGLMPLWGGAGEEDWGELGPTPFGPCPSPGTSRHHHCLSSVTLEQTVPQASTSSHVPAEGTHAPQKTNTGKSAELREAPGNQTLPGVFRGSPPHAPLWNETSLGEFSFSVPLDPSPM